MPGLLELEYESESHDAGLGIRIGIKTFGNMLVSESLAAGIGIVKICTLESDRYEDRKPFPCIYI